MKISRNSLLIKFAIDLTLAAAASWAAFALRLGLPIPKLYQRSELFYILLSLAIKVALILGFSLFRQSWRKQTHPISGVDQYASSPVSILYEKPAPCAKSGAVRLAHRAL